MIDMIDVIDVVIMIDVMRAALCSALAPPCCSDYHLLGGMAAARGDSLVKQKYLGAAPPASLLPPLEIPGGLRPPASLLPTYWGAAPPSVPVGRAIMRAVGRVVGRSVGRSGRSDCNHSFDIVLQVLTLLFQAQPTRVTEF